MKNDPLNNSNPWMEIPLADYERHMSDSTVGQLNLLNALTKKWLAKVKPATCLFMGIAGGNGLEHIDRGVTKKVIGIDINQDYLDVAFKRYNDRIDSLQLLRLDISTIRDQVCSADLIWAALVLEYAGVDSCLEFAKNNLLPGGHFIVTLQSNKHLPSVSPTGIESVKKAGIIFKAVEPGGLLAKAKEMGFTLLDEEENQLPNGKTFLTYHFIGE